MVAISFEVVERCGASSIAQNNSIHRFSVMLCGITDAQIKAVDTILEHMAGINTKSILYDSVSPLTSEDQTHIMFARTDDIEKFLRHLKRAGVIDGITQMMREDIRKAINKFESPDSQKK